MWGGIACAGLGCCVGGRVRQSRALGSCSPGAAAVRAGLSGWALVLAAVAVNRTVLIWELARTDFLTIRGQFWANISFLTAC